MKLNYDVINVFVCDVFRSNWDWLVERYTINDRYLGQLIPNICRYFATEEKLSEVIIILVYL